MYRNHAVRKSNFFLCHFLIISPSLLRCDQQGQRLVLLACDSSAPVSRTRQPPLRRATRQPLSSDISCSHRSLLIAPVRSIVECLCELQQVCRSLAAHLPHCDSVRVLRLGQVPACKQLRSTGCCRSKCRPITTTCPSPTVYRC